MMKVLIVGEFRWELYEKPLYEAFIELKYDTYKFEWSKYFQSKNKLVELVKKAEAKYRFGVSVKKLNRDLLKYIDKIRPNLVFIYQGVFFSRDTISKIKKYGALVFGYCNDDPFSKAAPRFFWRTYLRAVPAYTYIFSYRVKNIVDYQREYGIEAELLRSYYLKDRNYKIPQIDKRYKCDVMFIGHYENDGRDDALLDIARRGHSIKLYGDGWHRSKKYDELKSIMNGEIVQLRKDYNLAINSCKIALVFLSKLNNDTYTRRCFEIPATETFMLSEFSKDLATLFVPDKEAVYFNNKEELLDKVSYYLAHDEERYTIAQNGYAKVISEGHEIKDRVRQIVNCYHSLTVN